MAEIKTDLVKLEVGRPYNPETSDEYVITEDHTIADIVRFLIKIGGADDIQYYLDEELIDESNE